MKAFFTYASGLVNPFKTSHSNVVEIESQSRYKRFKCLDCGEQWTQNINSPQIVDDVVYNEFKDNYKPCNK